MYKIINENKTISGSLLKLLLKIIMGTPPKEEINDLKY